MGHSKDDETKKKNPSPNRKELAEQTRLWLTKGGILHEDSDDELGDEDHPWEWIYEDQDGDAKNGANAEQTPSKRGRQRKRQRKIIGARMGQFECKIGDTVLLKSPEAGHDWAGIICEFTEEENEDSDAEGDADAPKEMLKCANVMWFASPDEFMSTKKKRRDDALPNEQYITVDFNVNPLTSINGKANIMSAAVFNQKYPDGKPKAKAALAEYNKCIICRRGVSQLQGRYTEEFVWEEVYDGTEDGIFRFIDFIKAGLKRSKRKRVEEKEKEVGIPLPVFSIGQTDLTILDSTLSLHRMNLKSQVHPAKDKRQALSQAHLPRGEVKRFSRHQLTNESSSRNHWSLPLSGLESFPLLSSHLHPTVKPEPNFTCQVCQRPFHVEKMNSQWSTKLYDQPSQTVRGLVSTSQDHQGQAKLLRFAKSWLRSITRYYTRIWTTSSSSRSTA